MGVSFKLHKKCADARREHLILCRCEMLRQDACIIFLKLNP